MTSRLGIFHAPKSVDELAAMLAERLPEGDFARICIKPNWVNHETDERFPIRALVTSTTVLEAALLACLSKYPGVESIVIGDVPLQSCDWHLLSAQSGLDDLIRRYSNTHKPHVRFSDMRRERVALRQGFLVPADGTPEDPAGYREVVLDETSYLDPISQDRNVFRVSDYDPGEMMSNHRMGHHRYLICGAVLESELMINLPKMKTHQKAGVTGALKNLVGINGDKARLAHHRRGVDEFGPSARWIIRCQSRLREALQKRSRPLFGLGRALWRTARRLQGIHTAATAEALKTNRMYIGAGSWYGNDTIWRMIYDLNRIVRYASTSGGVLATSPQREYVAILDGICAGEGNGPLDPLPLDLGIVAVSDDPFLMDMAMARLMGFDPNRIPQLANYGLFKDPLWASFDPRSVPLSFDGNRLEGIDALPILHRFLPPPGWKDHIEGV